LGHLLALDYGSFQRQTSDLDNPPRFKLIDILDRLTHLRTHAEEDRKQRGSRVIQADVSDE
jgi:hypothetical protein